MEDIFKDGVCNELKQAMKKWELMAQNANTTAGDLEHQREKIHDLCAKLSAIERLERKVA